MQCIWTTCRYLDLDHGTADKVHLVEEWATRCPHPRGITAKQTLSHVAEWQVELEFFGARV